MTDNPNPKGLTAYMNIITMRATLQGFIVFVSVPRYLKLLHASTHIFSLSFDFADKFAAAGAEMVKWINEGSLKVQYHIIEGLQKAPEALPLLFSGGNTGKL